MEDRPVVTRTWRARGGPPCTGRLCTWWHQTKQQDWPEARAVEHLTRCAAQACERTRVWGCALCSAETFGNRKRDRKLPLCQLPIPFFPQNPDFLIFLLPSRRSPLLVVSGPDAPVLHFKREDSFFYTLFHEPSRFPCTEVKQEGKKQVADDDCGSLWYL